MSDGLSPRYRFVRPEELAGPLATAVNEIAEDAICLSAPPPERAQMRFASLRLNCLAAAGYAYALGADSDPVRPFLLLGCQAAWELFRRRGTESYTFEKNGVSERRIDFSLTNTRQGFLAQCECLASGTIESARALGPFIEDPPDASYIGPRSFCTAWDQKLAYGFKHLLTNDFRQAKAELELLRTLDPPKPISWLSTTIGSLMEYDARAFLDSLHSYLVWHQSQAQLPENRLDPRYYLCYPALGMARLAYEFRLCSLRDLPPSDFLPCQLIEAASAASGL